MSHARRFARTFDDHRDVMIHTEVSNFRSTSAPHRRQRILHSMFGGRRPDLIGLLESVMVGFGLVGVAGGEAHGGGIFTPAGFGLEHVLVMAGMSIEVARKLLFFDALCLLAAGFLLSRHITHRWFVTFPR